MSVRPNPRLKLGSIMLQRTPEKRSSRFSKEKYLRNHPSYRAMGELHIQIQNVLDKSLDLFPQKPRIFIDRLSEKMNQYKYLPLEWFDDTTYDKLSNAELLLRIERLGPI